MLTVSLTTSRKGWVPYNSNCGQPFNASAAPITHRAHIRTWISEKCATDSSAGPVRKRTGTCTVKFCATSRLPPPTDVGA